MTILNKIRSMFRRSLIRPTYSHTDIRHIGEEKLRPYAQRQFPSRFVRIYGVDQGRPILMDKLDADRLIYCRKHERSFQLSDSYEVILSDDDETLFRVTRP